MTHEDKWFYMQELFCRAMDVICKLDPRGDEIYDHIKGGTDEEFEQFLKNL